MRRRFIEFMQVKKSVSAFELARAFTITAANARHHLAELEEDGVIRIVETRVQGRGRPTQFYGLTSVLDRNNLTSLANAVWCEWIDGLPTEKKEIALKNITDRLLNNKMVPGGNLTQRITRAVRELNEMNYQVRWEAHITSPRILFTHCPYASMKKQHPELCQLDGMLLEKLLGFPVILISKKSEVDNGDIQCVFRLMLPKTA